MCLLKIPVYSYQSAKLVKEKYHHDGLLSTYEGMMDTQWIISNDAEEGFTTEEKYFLEIVCTIMDAEIEFSEVWYLPVFGLPPELEGRLVTTTPSLLRLLLL